MNPQVFYASTTKEPMSFPKSTQPLVGNLDTGRLVVLLLTLSLTLTLTLSITGIVTFTTAIAITVTANISMTLTLIIILTIATTFTLKTVPFSLRSCKLNRDMWFPKIRGTL